MVGADYPIVVPHQGGSVLGLVEDAVTQPEAARLAAYEGLDYVVSVQQVRIAAGGEIAAAVFIPTATLRPAAGCWDFARWQRTAKPAVLRSLGAYFGAT